MKAYRYSFVFYTLIALLAAATLPGQKVLAQEAQPASTPAAVTDSSVLASDAPAWPKHLGEQVRLLLNQPSLAQQENAMMLILRYTRHQSDVEVDFRPAVPALFNTYEGSAPEGHRLLALAALQSIGTPAVMERLARQVQHERPGKVRRLTLHALTAYQNAPGQQK